jgi:2'-5' RNA ligase
MRKSYKTAIVMIPPDSLWEPIQKIRSKMDSKFRRWMPHITLIYPFVPYEELKSAFHQLEKYTWNLPAFQLTLREISYFRHRRHYTIWLKPEPIEPLAKLVEKLNLIFPEFNDTVRFSKGFTPHLSLGQAKDKKDLQEKLSFIRKIWNPVSFEVHSFYLIFRHDPPDDIFRVYQEMPFALDGS